MLNKPKDELVTALNKLFWKIPIGTYYDCNEFARHIVSELIDANINTINWDEQKEEFYRTKKPIKVIGAKR